MNSRKSSASSTSSHGNSKLKPIQATTSSQKTALSSSSSSSINKNYTSDEKSNKKSYLENFSEEDIQKDKVKQRYEMLMSKLEDLTVEQKKSKVNKNLNGTSPLPSTSSKKVLPKIPKKDESTDSKLNAIKETKGSQSNSLNVNKLSQHTQNPISQSFAHLNNSDDDDESEDDAPINPIKAPNELLEEFLVYIMGKKWKDAQKLCQFILMYEPGNKTAKEFMPLIESKLNSSESGEDESDDEETSSNEATSESSNSDEDESNESTDEDEEEVNEKNKKSKEDYDDDDDVETPSSARLSKKKQEKEPFKFDLKK